MSALLGCVCVCVGNLKLPKALCGFPVCALSRSGFVGLALGVRFNPLKDSNSFDLLYRTVYDHFFLLFGVTGNLPLLEVYLFLFGGQKEVRRLSGQTEGCRKSPKRVEATVRGKLEA